MQLQISPLLKNREKENNTEVQTQMKVKILDKRRPKSFTDPFLSARFLPLFSPFLSAFSLFFPFSFLPLIVEKVLCWGIWP